MFRIALSASCLVALIALVLSGVGGCSAPVGATTPTVDSTIATSPGAPTASSARPNIIFILADDLDTDSIKVMPKLRSLLIDQGTSFSSAFVNVSLCCPSRATILRGQYATNTTIFGNTQPQGGFAKVYDLGLENSTIAVWLQDAGYKTMLAGKYLNGFPERTDPMYIPPGWSEWYSAVKGNAYGEYNYTLNENGKRVQYGNKPQDYGTDVYARKAVDFIERMSKEGSPFFIYLAPYAPHSPATPAPRHAKTFADAQTPRTPNFNEADVSDKPAYIRNRPLLTEKQLAQIDADYRKRLQSLLAIDDAIGNIVDALKAAGQLDYTYIVFTSDNGYHMGNHRMAQGRVAPYEEDIRVPLSVRGPGVPAGHTLDHIVGNMDFAPTFAEIGGVPIPEFVDGRSLLPLLSSNPPTIDTWRQAYLIESGMPKTTASLVASGLDTTIAPNVADVRLLEPQDVDEIEKAPQPAGGIPSYFGVRTRDYTYVEYETGERELYDLRADPYQLQNIASVKTEVAKQLSEILAALNKCSGASCRVADAMTLTK